MNVLPTELWMQVFQETGRKDRLKQMTTCRLFHSLLETKLYEDVQISWRVNEEEKLFPKVPRSTLFMQTLTARLELFSLVRELGLYTSDADEEIIDEKVVSTNNYWNHPILWQLPCFPQLRHLVLHGIHIEADCFTAIHSIPRLEYLKVQNCSIDTSLLDLQPFQRNTISTLLISFPKHGEGWAALMTPRLHTFIVESAEEDSHMDKVFLGFLPCDLHRTLTKLEWTLWEDFAKEFIQFIEPCVQLESLSITYQDYSLNDAEARSSHFEGLSSGSLPKLSKFGGSGEHTAAIITGRPVHSVSLQLWDDTPEDVLLALQRSKVSVTNLDLRQGDWDNPPAAVTGTYLEHMPETVEILSLHEIFDKATLRSWIPALSKLSGLQTIECSMDAEALSQMEVVRLLSEACPSIRKISLRIFGYMQYWGRSKWVARTDDSWEYYPE